MLISRLRDTKHAKPPIKRGNSGATIRHLHYFGMKFYVFDIGISGESGASLKV